MGGGIGGNGWRSLGAPRVVVPVVPAYLVRLSCAISAAVCSGHLPSPPEERERVAHEPPEVVVPEEDEPVDEQDHQPPRALAGGRRGGEPPPEPPPRRPDHAAIRSNCSRNTSSLGTRPCPFTRYPSG